jgi:hypothetical protein
MPFFQNMKDDKCFTAQNCFLDEEILHLVGHANLPSTVSGEAAIYMW